MPGLTAYVGLLDIGQPKPGETVVVAAATGAVGSIVGQIAKIHGCRVVGVAGGREKCDFAVGTLGFDACLDHRDADLREPLAAACPKGIDVYFENVGGAVLAAVLPLLNIHARVPLCGLVAWYNLAGCRRGRGPHPAAADHGAQAPHQDAGLHHLRPLAPHAGVLQGHEHLAEGGQGEVPRGNRRGPGKPPAGLMGMLRGENFGKLVVRVSGS